MSKKGYMFTEIKNYFESEQTQVEFCEDKDYSYESIKYWIKQYRINGNDVPIVKTQTSFQKIRLGTSPSDQVKKVLELNIPTGIQIKIFV